METVDGPLFMLILVMGSIRGTQQGGTYINPETALMYATVNNIKELCSTGCAYATLKNYLEAQSVKKDELCKAANTFETCLATKTGCSYIPPYNEAVADFCGVAGFQACPLLVTLLAFITSAWLRS